VPTILSRPFAALLLAATTTAIVWGSGPQVPALMPIEEVRPGMVGVGRTVYVAHQLEEFRVTILGVMRNVIGPRRNLILARLEGGPLANTGVIQGMSGSPVYVDGRLVGAVSYSLGSFPKEPIAGITPIAEMIEDINSRGPRPASARLDLDWPATPAQIFDALGRLLRQASQPLTSVAVPQMMIGTAAMGMPAQLRPIGAAFTVSGFEPSLTSHFAQALQSPVSQAPSGATLLASSSGSPLRPGDPVGMSLVRGDFEMGATGTVTHIDNNRVYAFGHPFLNLGPTDVAMTEAHVVTVLPSLDSSMKLASLGRIIGTVTQDRATAIGGTLGNGPKELAVRLILRSPGRPSQQFEFFVLNDPMLTPIFTYAAVANALVGWERQTGAMSVHVRGALDLGSDGTIEIDDAFSGDSALTTAAASATAALGVLMPNPFRAVSAESLTLEVETSEAETHTTIERAWLETTRPRPGSSYRVHVQLRDYRGQTRVVDVPITIPAQLSGPATLLVSDGATLQALEQRELRPSTPGALTELLARTRQLKRGNRLYVRLLTESRGTVVGGDVLPGLPASMQAAVQADTAAPRAALERAVVGAWEERLDRQVRGSRELPLTVDPSR
jgi:hypothetical protein